MGQKNLLFGRLLLGDKKARKPQGGNNNVTSLTEKNFKIKMKNWPEKNNCFLILGPD